MSKYRVTLEEAVVYHVEVEAESEEDAKNAAEEAFTQAEDANAFFSHVDDRVAVDAELIEDGETEDADDPEVEEADGLPDD